MTEYDEHQQDPPDFGAELYQGEGTNHKSEEISDYEDILEYDGEQTSCYGEEQEDPDEEQEDYEYDGDETSSYKEEQNNSDEE